MREQAHLSSSDLMVIGGGSAAFAAAIKAAELGAQALPDHGGRA